MTELGEGSSVANTEEVKAETGAVKISVRSVCDGERIPEASITIGLKTLEGGLPSRSSP